MNKLIANIFVIIFPFYPIWAWLCYSLTKKPFDFVISIMLFPIALYFVIYVNKKLPKYLLFFILFTIYHLCSAFIHEAFPENTNTVYFLLTDPHVLACLFFIIIEYVNFDEAFITKMNKHLLLIVILSLVVSLIQIKFPDFFFNLNMDEDLLYVGENRNFSIYSWTNLNTAGVTFPILISILISVNQRNKATLLLLILAGSIVCFLTRARYAMISIITVISQLFFNQSRSVKKKVSLAIMIVAGILITGFAASKLGYDLNEVFESRILEKQSDMASAKTRILSYEVFMIVFPDNPWLGVGPETKQDVIDLLGGEAPVIHIGYLSYLYFYGIVGCSFLFIAMFYLFKHAWSVGKTTNFWGGFYGLISFCLANLTFVYFNFSEMGIVLSVIYLRYYSCKAFLPIDQKTFKGYQKSSVSIV